MRAGSNSKAPSKGRPHSKPSSKKWFGMLANRQHRLRNFFYKEKNSEDTTNDEVHSWRRDRCGSHLLLRFVERTRGDAWSASESSGLAATVVVLEFPRTASHYPPILPPKQFLRTHRVAVSRLV